MLFYYRGGCLVLPPTAPNCKELQAVKGYIWNVTLSGFFWSDFMQAVQLGIWFRQQAVKVGSFLLISSELWRIAGGQGLNLLWILWNHQKALYLPCMLSVSWYWCNYPLSLSRAYTAIFKPVSGNNNKFGGSLTSCSLFTVEESGLNLSDSSNRKNVQAVKVWISLESFSESSKSPVFALYSLCKLILM